MNNSALLDDRKFWFVFVLFGFVQVILDQFGLTFSYESLFEYEPSNKTNVFGTATALQKNRTFMISYASFVNFLTQFVFGRY